MINQQKIDNLAQAIRDAIDTQITAYNDDLMATLNGETTTVTFTLEFGDENESIPLSAFYSHDCSVKIYEDSTILATQEVNSNEITFDNIPDGTYRAEFSYSDFIDGCVWGSYIPDTENNIFTVDSSHRRFTLKIWRGQEI